MPIIFQNRPGLVIYLTAGDPSLATTRDMAIAAIDAGADVIELGVPFSDPLADGPVIQRASERAVARGTRLADVLETCLDIRKLRPQRRHHPLQLSQPRHPHGPAPSSHAPQRPLAPTAFSSPT